MTVPDIIACPQETSLRRAIAGICKDDIPSQELEAWILDTAASQGMQLSKVLSVAVYLTLGRVGFFTALPKVRLNVTVGYRLMVEL